MWRRRAAGEHALMTLIALLRLVEHGQWRTTGLALLLVGGVVALMRCSPRWPDWAMPTC